MNKKSRKIDDRFYLIVRGSNSYWSIYFFDKNKKRKVVTLSASKYTEKTAKGLYDTIERLVADHFNNSKKMDKVAEAWLMSANQEIRMKLAKAGLIIVTPALNCEKLWDDYLKSRQRGNQRVDLGNLRTCETPFF